MITVTDSAKQKLGEMLDANTNDPGSSLRLVSREGQFDLVIDKEKPGDHVFEHEGAKVLLVGSDLGGVLDEATIDYQQTLEGQQLVISRG